MDYATRPLERTPNKVENGRYKIDIDNNRGVPLILTLDNEDEEMETEFNWQTYREILAKEEYNANRGDWWD